MFMSNHLIGFGAVEAVASFPVVAGTNNSLTASASTTHTVSLPASISAGDLLLIFLSTIENTYTTPSGWTQLFQVSGSSQNVFACFYKVASGGEGASVAVTCGAAREGAHQSYRITGYTGSPESQTSSNGTDANPNPPSLTPAAGSGNYLWIAACGAYKSGSLTVSSSPSGYTNGFSDQSSTGGVSALVASARKEAAGTVEDPGTFTLSGSPVSHRAATVSVKGA